MIDEVYIREQFSQHAEVLNVRRCENGDYEVEVRMHPTIDYIKLNRTASGIFEEVSDAG